VLVGARDPARGSAVVAELRATGANAELFEIDLASFASIRAACERFAAGGSGLDVLVNNAGLLLYKPAVSVDGHELTWATNFLGLFLLTRSLVPMLRVAPEPRVVNVSSVAHTYGRIAWDDLDYRRHRFGTMRTYSQSKLAVVLFTRELARREPGIAVNAVHPGAIATRIWRNLPAVANAFMGRILPPAERGAIPVVRLAVEPEFAHVSGRYFDKLRDVAPAKAALNDIDAARLWAVAEIATAPSLS
jgi:NAD(P)-dependent dehydrogenase (short-subunit alcohol dehydrogenase family)